MKVVLLFSLLVLNQEKYLAVFSCQMPKEGIPKSMLNARNLFQDVLIERAQKITSYNILTRENIVTVLKRKNIDPEECVKAVDVCAVEYAQSLGADRAVSCGISPVGDDYYIVLHFYDVRTGRVLNTTSGKTKGDVDLVIELLKSRIEKLLGTEKIGEGRARVFIKTNTRGVNFEIDGGKITGRIDDEKVVYLDAGVHTLRFFKEGFEEMREEVFCEAGRVKTIEVNLFPERKEKLSGSGSIDIVTEPDGAEIFIDGEQVRNPDNSPALTPYFVPEIPAGTHNILLRKPFYKTETVSVRVDRDEEVKLKIPLKEHYGRLRVESQPSGATLYIDGMNVGSTPYTEEKTEVKAYALKLTLPNYHDYEEVLYVNPKETTLKRILLRPAFGSLRVNGTKGATVFIDGREEGKIPFFKEVLSPGEHWVEIKHELYKPLRKRVMIEEGMTEEINAILEENFGYLSVRTKFSDVPIILDGKEIGKGHISDYLISAGEHRLTVGDSERFRVWERKIAVGIRERKEVHAEPVPRLGTIILTTEPRDAEVYIDGKKVGTSPGRFKVIRGKHTIQLKKEGYEEWREGFFIEENEEKKLSVKLPRFKPAYLTIELNTSAEVFLNDKKLGKGKSFSLEVPSNELIRVVAKKKGYFSEEKTVSLYPGERESLRIALKERPPLGILSAGFSYNHSPMEGYGGRIEMRFFLVRFFTVGFSFTGGSADLKDLSGSSYQVEFPLEVRLGRKVGLLIGGYPYVYFPEINGNVATGGGIGIGFGIYFLREPVEVRTFYTYGGEVSGVRVMAGLAF